jgi:hypothetical protein
MNKNHSDVTFKITKWGGGSPNDVSKCKNDKIKKFYQKKIKHLLKNVYLCHVDKYVYICIYVCIYIYIYTHIN